VSPPEWHAVTPASGGDQAQAQGAGGWLGGLGMGGAGGRLIAREDRGLGPGGAIVGFLSAAGIVGASPRGARGPRGRVHKQKGERQNEQVMGGWTRPGSKKRI